MKNYQDSHTDTQFRNFLDEIAFRPVKSDTSDAFYDKKYFDYLPTDDKSAAAATAIMAGNEDNDEKNDELSVELQPPPEKQPPQQRENHRRLKRQTVDCTLLVKYCFRTVALPYFILFFQIYEP